MKQWRLAAPLLSCLVLSMPARAASNDSAYTKLDIDECRKTGQYELGASWICQGYKGLPVYFAEGDLRMFISFGPNAENEVAAKQTFLNFNNVHGTLEWRVRMANGDWRPFATIHRWFVDLGAQVDVNYPILTVTTLGPNGVCHVAYIDARVNKNANVLAREAADTLADVFNCGSDKATWYGKVSDNAPPLPQ